MTTPPPLTVHGKGEAGIENQGPCSAKALWPERCLKSTLFRHYAIDHQNHSVEGSWEYELLADTRFKAIV